MKLKFRFSLVGFISLLFLSCSQEDALLQPQLDELAVIENQYEANLKGYLITEPKDESKKSDGIETLASDSFVNLMELKLLRVILL